MRIKYNSDFFLDPAKSFDFFNVGKDMKKLVLGKYSPTVDSVSFLTNVEGVKAKDMFKNNQPWEMATKVHELSGHTSLTKDSSLGGFLTMHNFFSYLLFLSILNSNDAEIIKDRTSDLIIAEETNNLFHDLWEPLQEIAANVSLNYDKMLTQDDDIKEIYASFIDMGKSKSKNINKLTEMSNDLMNEIGIFNAFILISGSAVIASSPPIKDFTIPKNVQEFKKINLNLQRFYEEIKLKSHPLNPIHRFWEMLDMITKCKEEIKISFKRKSNPLEIPNYIASLLGHKIEFMSDLPNNYYNQINENISNNDNFTKNSNEYIESFFNTYVEIFQEQAPTFWLLKDINSGRFFLSEGKISRKHPELLIYLQMNLLKCQFIRSIKTGGDFINCFQNKFSFCDSKCSSCQMYPQFKRTNQSFNKLMKLAYS